MNYVNPNDTEQKKPVPSHWEGDYQDLSIEDFLEEAKPSPGPLYSLAHQRAFGPALYWSIVIVISSVFYWLFESRWDLTASYNAIISDGEIWKAWSSLFIHSDITHLLSNLWLFAIFGYLVRAFWGPVVFPIITFLVLGGLTTFMTVYYYGPGPRLLGASGMIYGMIALWLVTYCRYETRYSLKMRLFRSIGFVLIMLFPTTITKNVSYSAHFFGFVVGIVLGLLLIWQRGEASDQTESAKKLSRTNFDNPGYQSSIDDRVSGEQK